MFGLDKIEWSTEVYAPRHYYVRLITGHCFWFYNKSGTRLGFSGGAGGGWRSTGAYIRGGIPDKKVTLPDAVQLTWLAETERKFYQVQFELPRDKILELFKNKVITLEYGRKVKSIQDGINFAIEPGGMVFLRTSGAQTIELGRYQAKEIPMEWWYFAKSEAFDGNWLTPEKYYEMRYEEIPQYIQEQYKDGTIPVGRWTAYSTHKYPWKLYIPKTEMQAYYIEYVNNEQYLVDQSNLAHEQSIIKPVPASIYIYYEKNGQRYKHSIFFSKHRWATAEQPEDDLAVFNRFKAYFEEKNSSAMLEIDLSAGDAKAYLNNGLTKKEIKIYHQWLEKMKPLQF